MATALGTEQTALRELTQALRDLNAEREFVPLVSAILQTACRLVHAEAAVLLLANRRTGLLEIAAIENMPSELVLEYQHRPARLEGLAACAGGERAGLSAHETREAELIRRLAAGGCACAEVLPVVNQEKTIGALTLAAARPVTADPGARERLDLLLAYIAQALENAYLIFHLREQNARLEFTMTKLQNTQNHLKRTEKVALVGKVAAAVAHEVRNPLTVIHGTLQMMLEKHPAADPDHGLFETMLAKVRSVDLTVKELLTFARPVELRVAPLHLTAVLDKVQTFVAKKFESRGLTLCLELEPDLPRVLLDEGQAQRIFLNLFLNAFTAAPECGWVQVRAWREPGRPYVLAAVADNGPGVPAEAAAQIFDPFFTTRADGTGLGLFLIKHLLEEMQGGIELRNPGAAGAEFLLRLPIASEIPLSADASGKSEN
jgi:two-component system, NtrC family, sensor histidine kinase HydH